MIPQIMSGNLTAVAWKLAAGLGYGTVLGLLRLKTKNFYSSMLLHGVLNIFYGVSEGTGAVFLI